MQRLGELAHHFLEAAPRGDLAKAIDYAQRAGAQDMEQLAYEDAVDVYGRALEVLELMDEPDEALRCSLLLSLGGAEAKSARVADARAAFERAAESARRLDDTDSLVGAAIGIAMMSDAGRLDEQLLALLDEALERIGPERTARRAALLSAKSAEMYWVDNDVRESTELVNEAIEIAREVDAPTTLAAALTRKIFIPTGPDAPRSGWRSPTRCSSWASARGDREAVVRGHAYRLWDLLELGDVAGVDRELTPTRGWRRSCACRSTSGTPSRCAGCGPCSTATSRRPSGSPRRRGGRATAPSSRSRSSTTASR